MGKIILVTGGARSGKSSWAQSRAEESQFTYKRVFVATALPLDDEMSKRIEKHREDRDSTWNAIEAPYDLECAIKSIVNDSVICIDCLTVWLGNIWFQKNGDENEMRKSCESLRDYLKSWEKTAIGELIIVTNEVGWGIVPEDPGVRVFRDVAGFLNKSIAGIANEVVLTVCGVPLKIK
jgi:adenosylcobinamide kinase/adenosylcobinamide-phosphate guanylyltransferase